MRRDITNSPSTSSAMPQYSESPGTYTNNSVTIPEVNSDQPMVVE